MSLACLLRNAEILTACQSICKRDKRDSIPKREEDGDANALCFLDTGVGLQRLAQRLAQILCQSFKLTIVSAVAWKNTDQIEPSTIHKSTDTLKSTRGKEKNRIQK